jgi:8-oxo-dGTP pyrophosphatase MutT (NUDIX family)
MRDSTLCFLIRGDPPQEILLGLKKVRFGAGKYNGFGGKVHAGEAVHVAAARELHEETGVCVSPSDLQPVGRLAFSFPARPDWDQRVHVFLATGWEGTPVESEEMRPAWFPADRLPLDRMWQDDQHWLPRVLAGECVEARFTFQEDNETLAEFHVERVRTGQSEMATR